MWTNPPKTTLNITKSDIKFYGPNGYGKLVKIDNNNLTAGHYSITVNNKNLSNGDNVKVTIKTDKEYPGFSNGTHEQTFESVVSGLTEKVKPLYDVDLKDSSIVNDVKSSLLNYSLQRQSKIFYDFGYVTDIPVGVFMFNDDEMKITSLPENINFSGLVTLGSGNFRYVKKLPENIDFSSVVSLGGLEDLTSLPENIDLSSVELIDGLYKLKSLPENIDLSSLTTVIGLYELTSLPNSIRFKSTLTWSDFRRMFSELYDEQWFNSHKKASTTP